MPDPLISTGFSRRTALGMAAGLAAAPAFSAIPGDKTFIPLKDLAAAKGLRFGTAVGIGNGAFHDPRVREILTRDCNILVPENELKMYVTHNHNATDYNFAPADEMLAFAETNHMAMRGHNLIWARDEFTPGWLKAYDFGSKPKLEAEKLLRTYIARICEHYGERLTSWDVVNEAVNPETGHVRASVFTRILGIDALRIAFEATREHLPKTQLVYNDYMSWEAGNETHRIGVLNLLSTFRKLKLPVDALGVQSHIGNGFALDGGQVAEWATFLDEVVAMGYELLITEFDVNDQKLEGTLAERDATVAKTARVYLDQILSYKQVKDVLMWGMADKYCWLQTFSPRADKLPLRPTPYDDAYAAKPLRSAIADAFKAAPAR